MGLGRVGLSVYLGGGGGVHGRASVRLGLARTPGSCNIVQYLCTQWPRTRQIRSHYIVMPADESFNIYTEQLALEFFLHGEYQL